MIQNVLDQQFCLSCNIVEDEEHFVIACKDNAIEQALFINKLLTRDPSFANFTNKEKIIFLMAYANSQILTWLVKFLHLSYSFLNWNILRHNVRKS